MGGDNSKIGYRNAIIQLTTRTQPIDTNNDKFWEQFWSQNSMSVHDIFALIPAEEIRALRTEAPNNLATLCYKTVERLSQIVESVNLSIKDQQTALNCVRLLTRILPYIFEDHEWQSFFWSVLPTNSTSDEGQCMPLAQILLSALCDLLFSPDFTVQPIGKPGPDCAEDVHTVDSCEYIWEAGVGFSQTSGSNSTHDSNRTEIMKLILTCFSETMYVEQDELHHKPNKWIGYFTSTSNRHALPLFTSLLNVVCAYDPVGYGVPYNHLMFTDTREPLTEIALQVLCLVLECDLISSPYSGRSMNQHSSMDEDEHHSSVNCVSACQTTTSHTWISDDNLFVNYMSRIHRDEDFSFILNGLIRLLNNPLTQTYLPGSSKKVQMHEELLILFWRMCECNKKFMYFVLKSSQVLDVLVPILFHLSNGKIDQSRMGLIHVGVFILLLLSGERNFGVRLNKPYRHRVVFDLPVFTGTHGDLLIIVAHKLITSGHNRLNPLFDCLLTIISNVSPYLKSLSMVSANKLLHLLDVFSQPWFLYCSPSNYQLVFLLLEIFNNIIQYQFDGNSNLVYTLIRRRQLFYRLANLSTDQATINSVLRKHQKSIQSTQFPVVQDHSHAVVTSIDVDLNEKSPTLTIQSDKTTEPRSDAEVLSNLNLQISGDSFKVCRYDANAVNCPTTLPPLNKLTDKHLGNATPLDHKQLSHSSVDQLSSHEQSNMKYVSEDLVSHSTPNNETYGVGASDDLDNSTSMTYQKQIGLNVSGITAESLKPRLKSAKDNDTSSVKYGGRYKSIYSEDSSTIIAVGNASNWEPTSEWVMHLKSKMPFQTIMRLLQVLVPQVEKICIDKGLTDESEIVRFLQNGTLVGLLPVPHPILIRKYQSNIGTTMWFRNYLWGVIYLRNVTPPIWYDTNIRLFEIQRIA